MGSGVGTKSFVLVCFLFLCGTWPSLQAAFPMQRNVNGVARNGNGIVNQNLLPEEHSLYYIYTALSRPLGLQGIHEFTAMGLLDDRQIDYYDSDVQKKVPKQPWMEAKMQKDYWDKGTQSRKSKEQWFNVNVKILMDRMRDNDSDVHVLQWRHGCEIKGNEFIRGIDEYSYDGVNFLAFDDKESQWVAPVDAALPTKRKWDNVPILNQYTKGYLEKECVDWLNKFRTYGDEELINGVPPKVHVFAKKSDKSKLKLTCLATGFYPKDITMVIRKYRTPLPNNEVESTQVRPNHDGTFQLRKSVNIKEEEKAEYDCIVSHRTLKESIVEKWDGKCKDCNEGSFMMIGIVIGALVAAALIVGVCLYLYKTKRIAFPIQRNVNGVARNGNGVVNQNLLPVSGNGHVPNGGNANGPTDKLLPGVNGNGHVPNGGNNAPV